MLVFEVDSSVGKRIRLTEERWWHILNSHVEMKNELNRLKLTVLMPDIVIKTSDDSIWLFHRYFAEVGKYLRCVVKILNHEGFVVTSYFIKKIRIGG